MEKNARKRIGPFKWIFTRWHFWALWFFLLILSGGISQGPIYLSEFLGEIIGSFIIPLIIYGVTYVCLFMANKIK